MPLSITNSALATATAEAATQTAQLQSALLAFGGNPQIKLFAGGAQLAVITSTAVINASAVPRRLLFTATAQTVAAAGPCDKAVVCTSAGAALAEATGKTLRAIVADGSSLTAPISLAGLIWEASASLPV